VVFIRGGGGNQGLLIEVRRQQPVDDDALLLPCEELNESWDRAAEGVEFSVTYYPGRCSGSPFVVPRGAVDEAMGKEWVPGMEVRVRPSDLVQHFEEPLGAAVVAAAATGTITAVTPGLVWGKIQVVVVYCDLLLICLSLVHALICLRIEELKLVSYVVHIQ
jgi:hypothetical protein